MSVNVVVVVWDTVRGAETVPADETLTPTLASIAERGTEYTRAFATAPWTLPSHGSLFTGTYPSRHGAHSDSAHLDGRLPTLPELFRDAGYETMAVSNNTWIAEEFGFARGFDAFVEQTIRRAEDRSLRDGLARVARAPPTEWDVDAGSLGGLWRRLRDELGQGARDDGADRTVRRIRRWLETRADDPFFLFVNLIEAHLEYRPPRRLAARHLPDGWSYDEAMELPQDPRAFDAGEFSPTEEEWAVLRALYRGEIAYLDERLGRLRAALEAVGAWDETLLVVTSDHGENVGEHRLLGHQYSLYDTVLHVPLFVHGGAFAGGADGSDELVQSVDLAPTLLDAAGVEAPAAREGFQGRSFHPETSDPGRTYAFAEYYGPRPPVERLEERFGEVPERIHAFQRSLRAVRTHRHKYVRGGGGAEELYDLSVDPGEADDAADRVPEVAAELGSTLDSWLSSFDHAEEGEPTTISSSTERQLANLGYM